MARSAEPVPATKQQLGYLRGLKRRRLAMLPEPASREEVVEVAVLYAMFNEPSSFAMAARMIDALKEDHGVLAFARGKNRKAQYTKLLHALMKQGLLSEPYPTSDEIAALASVMV